MPGRMLTVVLRHASVELFGIMAANHRIADVRPPVYNLIKRELLTTAVHSRSCESRQGMCSPFRSQLCC